MTAARRQLAVFAGVLVFAALVLVSGFDRMSEQRPSFARFVPTAFAASSVRRQAADFLAIGNSSLAERAARHAVGADPTDARGLAFLAVALLEQGQLLPAHAAFVQASRLSQREPLSQLYLFEQELAVGSYVRAAARLDAVLRSSADGEVAQTMLAMYELRAGENAAFAARLAGNPRWAEAYLRAEGSDPRRLREKAVFLSRPDLGLAAIGCEAVRPLVSELANRNFRREAEAVTRRHCAGEAPAGAIADADFAHFSDESAVLGWRRYSSGDVRVTKLTGKEARVEMENRSSVTRLALSQPVALAPGTYILRAKVDGPGGDSLVASLDCSRPARPRAGRARLDRDGQRLVAPSCPDAVLGLWLRPASGRVVIDRVEIDPLKP